MIFRNFQDPTRPNELGGASYTHSRAEIAVDNIQTTLERESRASNFEFAVFHPAATTAAPSQTEATSAAPLHPNAYARARGAALDFCLHLSMASPGLMLVRIVSISVSAAILAYYHLLTRPERFSMPANVFGRCFCTVFHRFQGVGKRFQGV